MSPPNGSVEPSRRSVVGAVAAGGLASSAQAQAPAPFTDLELQAAFDRYAGFGDKAAGGPGDNACGAWLQAKLEAVGYACRRQTYDVPAFLGESVELVTGANRADVVPQAIVTPTVAEGLNAPMRLAGAADVEGGIVLDVLPYGRWSALRGPIEQRVRAAFGRGAAAVVLVTTGPTGEAIALNAPVDRPLFDRPVAMLAPKAAQPFLDAARVGAPSTLRVTGRAVRRPAFNLIASLHRGAGRALVLSTPRSGWFSCVGERGPGLATWLALARWAARTPLRADIELLCTSGHEYDNAGGAHYLETLAPPPARTALWIHLGANVAARDWHERGATLSPLPSADPQRYLLASPAILGAVRKAFAGQPGLEQAYPATAEAAAGELQHILKAGYDPAAGIFGSHRFHHTVADDLRCVSPPLTRAVAEACAVIIRERLQG